MRSIAQVGFIAQLGLVSVLTLLVSPARAADVCIDVTATAALSCGDGDRLAATVTKRRPLVYRPPAADAPTKPVALAPPTTTEAISRGSAGPDRQTWERGRQLLLQEIANVSKLDRDTPFDSPDKPRILRRLAEAYVDLAAGLSVDARSKTELADGIRALNPPRAELLDQQAAALDARVERARRQAVQYYTTLSTRFPTYCRFPHQPKGLQSCTDEVLYFMAYELELLGDHDAARRTYQALIDNHTTSAYLTNAQLALGEVAFAAAERDPGQWPAAQRAYEKVLLTPAPGNQLYGYAQYKLGYVHWHRQDYGRAIAAFKAAIETGTRHPTLPNAAALVAAARRDIVPVYALKGDPAKAFDFFKPLSGDEPHESTRTLAMVEALGAALYDTGHYPEALVLYPLLAKLSPARACRYQARIAKATLAVFPADKERLEAELRTLHRHAEAALASFDQRAESRACANETVAQLAETAMAWHVEAVGSGGVIGTDDVATMESAEALYALLLTTFSPEQLAQLEFPRLPESEWPSAARIHYARADLAYHRERWRECGEGFLAAYEAAPDGGDAADSLYTSALCWQHLYDERHLGTGHRLGEGIELTADASYEPAALSEEQQGMLRAFDRYACHLRPPRGDAAALDAYVEMKFARARTYYEAAHYDRAALAFRDIAVTHPEHEAAVYAANLYLESLNVLGSRWHRPACIGDMRRDAPTLQRNLCTPARRAREPEQCRVIDVVVRDLHRLEAQALLESAGDDAEGVAKRRRAGELLEALWTSHGRALCKNERSSEGCDRYADILARSAAAYDGANMTAKAIAVRQQLVDPDNRLHGSEQAREALYAIGAAYHTIAADGLAAEWYLRFARSHPAAPQAPVAASNAVVLLLATGEVEPALKAARSFRHTYGTTQPRWDAQIQLALAQHHASSGSSTGTAHAIALLERSRVAFAEHATGDVRLQAQLLLAQLYDDAERGDEAATAWLMLRQAASDLDTLRKDLAATGEPRRQRARRLRSAKEAISVALLQHADRLRSQVVVAPPSYARAHSPSDVTAYVNEEIGSWLAGRTQAIEAAAAAYHAVVELDGGRPSPAHALVAGAAVGGMWAELVTAAATASHPPAWELPGVIATSDPPVAWQALRQRYREAMDAALAPYRARAEGAYRDCVEYGVLYHYFEGELRTCEAWLETHAPPDGSLQPSPAPQPVALPPRQRQ